MRIKTLSGHLTQTNKQHVKYLIENGYTSGKINRINYYINKDGNIYTVKTGKKEIHTIGDTPKLKWFTATFTI